MVSSITQDPYSIIISLNLASFVNLNIGAPPRSTELHLAGRAGNPQCTKKSPENAADRFQTRPVT